MDLYNFILSQCVMRSNAVIAQSMKAYMKGQFDFYGINAPLRKEIVKEAKKNMV